MSKPPPGRLCASPFAVLTGTLYVLKQGTIPAIFLKSGCLLLERLTFATPSAYARVAPQRLLLRQMALWSLSYSRQQSVHVYSPLLFLVPKHARSMLLSPTAIYKWLVLAPTFRTRFWRGAHVWPS